MRLPYVNRISAFLILLGLVVLITVPASASAGVGQNYDLARLIKQYIQDNASWGPEDTHIEFITKIPEVALKGEKISYEISRNGKDALIGDCSFVVRFFDDGVQIARYLIRTDVEVQETYLASARVIPRNAIIASADIQVMRRWVRLPSLKVISNADEVIGKRLTVDVGPDREIKRAMLKEPILVKKGEVVRIVLDHGQMSLMATGVAEEEGADRQHIRVKNLSSQKVILAQVMAEGMVRVELF